MADPRIDELLETVGIAEVADKKMRQFSGGMLQRVGIAQAMVTDPELLILRCVEETGHQLRCVAGGRFGMQSRRAEKRRPPNGEAERMVAGVGA